MSVNFIRNPGTNLQKVKQVEFVDRTDLIVRKKLTYAVAEIFGKIIRINFF